MGIGEELKARALRSGASHAGILNTSDIEFHEDFRKACERNYCRKYDTNWMGPPAIGPIIELKQRVLRYSRGLLFQTTHPVASPFDLKGMLAAGETHRRVFRDFLAEIRNSYPDTDILPLDVGCCSECERCAYLDQAPCRHPDIAVSSVEAYGMHVIALQKSAGLPCHFGKTTVCFVGLILFGFHEASPVAAKYHIS